MSNDFGEPSQQFSVRDPIREFRSLEERRLWEDEQRRLAGKLTNEERRKAEAMSKSRERLKR